MRNNSLTNDILASNNSQLLKVKKMSENQPKYKSIEEYEKEFLPKTHRAKVVIEKIRSKIKEHDSPYILLDGETIFISPYILRLIKRLDDTKQDLEHAVSKMLIEYDEENEKQ